VSDAHHCPSCGRPVRSGQLICECGAAITSEQLGRPELPQIGMPKLNLKMPDVPSLDFSLPEQMLQKSPLPNLEKLALDDLGMDVGSRNIAQGRPYRPLMVIGATNGETGTLRLPFSLVQLADGRLYVMDFMDEDGRARVQMFDAAGELARVVREFDVGSGSGTLDTPAGIVIDSQENFYVTDMGTSSIKKYSPEGEILAVFGSEGTGPQQLMSPQDLELDTAGHLYVADTSNNRILKWDQQGNCLMTLGINELDEDNGWLMAGDGPGEFDDPQGVTVDREGRIFVADTNNHRVQVFGPTGKLLLTFGEEGESAGEISYPNDIQVDVEGNIYISDSDGGRIQKFDAGGHFVYQIILPSDAGSVGDFEIDDDGHILIALRKAHVVLKLEVM
jgi:sugar lactone lactonase YvrE